MRSMTGIGTGRARKGKLAASVELRSVNHRFLDLVFRLPPAMGTLEMRLRERLSQEIDRGRISIALELEHADPVLQIELNEPFVEAYVRQARKLARRHGLLVNAR